MSRNLLQRIAFAVPAIAVTVLAIWRGGWALAVLLAVLGVLGTREVFDLARRQDIDPLDWLGYLAAAGIPFAAIWAREFEAFHWAEAALFLSALWVLAVLVHAAVVRGPTHRPLTAVAVTVFGVIYASALLSFVVVIRHGEHSDAHPLASTALVMLPLVVTWICDTAAMAAGTLIGGPKLAPVLSPRKTWAGAIGGGVAAVGAALAYGPLVLDRLALHVDAVDLFAVGVVVGIGGQVGDVSESLFKREAGVKDSSTLIPGHGGVLDRLDSLYFVLPLSAGIFRILGLV
ncbi:MAG TPA: phosphatidate cytidylyltransferase [Gemmatimonadales bacterium]|nr:phosphatidate cytidylyltransferase [Gemmatimonadales bacterium]